MKQKTFNTHKKKEKWFNNKMILKSIQQDEIKDFFNTKKKENDLSIRLFWN